MLLRNLNSPKLCNGTRLQVNTLNKHVIQATVFLGVGKTVFIPHIPTNSVKVSFSIKTSAVPCTPCPVLLRHDYQQSTRADFEDGWSRSEV
jgi:hypothetical protein